MKSRNQRKKNVVFSDEDFRMDCPAYAHIPTVMPARQRVIAIGDIHGDLDLAHRSFMLAELMDANYNWIAIPSNTVVVQVGDQIDSCRPIPGVNDCHNSRTEGDKGDDIRVLEFFDEMHEKAKRVGGAVYSLLGNHELMNAQKNFTYVSYDNFHKFHYEDVTGAVFEGPKGRFDAFTPGSHLTERLACARQSVLIIGSTMFAHAGVLPVLASKLDHLDVSNDKKLEYLNAVVRKWLLGKLANSHLGDKNLITSDIHISPFWTRIYGSIPIDSGITSEKCNDHVQKAIKVYKIGQLVVGHTPQMKSVANGINGTCYESDGHNRLYRVDGGFADAFKQFNDSHAIQVLEILDDSKFNILTETSFKRKH